MKNLFVWLTAAALLGTLAGCSQEKSPATPSVPEAPISEQTSSEPEDPAQPQAPVEYEYADENLSMVVTMLQGEYSLDEKINMQVSVANIGEKPIAYVHGSGSNHVPDAMILTLEDFAGLFYPEVMTMDYRVNILKPGETLELETPFVPYSSLEDKKAFGFEQDIPFFQTDAFKPAEPGTANGTITFTYKVLESTDEATMLEGFEDLEPAVLTGTFETTITQ